MKTVKTIINIIGLLTGVMFLVAGGTDIQIGFGATMILVAVNGLIK
jgi:hypothetical protein